MSADLITAYARHLRDQGRATATIEQYLWLLLRIDAALPAGLAKATTAQLRLWLATEEWSPSTRHHYRAAIRGFFLWACDPDEPLLDTPDPSRRLAKVKVPDRVARPIRDDQLATILERARSPYLLWFLLAALGGLRCIEIAQLHREDVTAEQMWVQGKGGKARLVPTHSKIWETVRHLPPGPLAVDELGEHLDRAKVAHRGNHHLAKILGGRGVSMHRLRHWFATATYASSGEDIRAVQELLGHSNVAVTQRYVQVGSGRKAAAVAALSVPGGVR